MAIYKNLVWHFKNKVTYDPLYYFIVIKIGTSKIKAPCFFLGGQQQKV